MFLVIMYRLLINAVKLAVVEIRSYNDLLRSQASQGTALYFLIRNVIFLYTVPPALYGGVE
jgi:NADH:ubiquinone oxidoreductase subunit K